MPMSPRTPPISGLIATLLLLASTGVAQDLAEGVAHYWTLDRADLREGRCRDRAGTLDLLVEGAAATAPGRFGEAVAGPWLSGGGCVPAAPDMTVSAWIWYDPAGDGWQTIASLGNHDRWTLQLDHGRLGLTADMTPGVAATAPIAAGRWIHVAATVADADHAPGGPKHVVLWQDGVQAAEGTLAWDATPEVFVVANTHRGGDHAFTGRIDELSIWDRCLAPAEIAGLARATTALGGLVGEPATVWAEVDPTPPAEAGPVTTTFRVRRARAGRELRVRVSWLGWAENGRNYQALPELLTIPRGATAAEAVLRPLPDGIIKGRQSVIMRLEPGVGYEVRPGGGEALTRIASATPPPARDRRIFAHFMGCFCAGTGAIQYHATSGLAGMEAPDWAQHRQPGAPSRLVEWARQSVGGGYRNFGLAPFGKPLPLEEAADLEIRRAMRIGIDGFTFDAWAGGGDAMRLFETMLRICEEKDYPFALTITPDATCLKEDMPEFKPYAGDVYRKALRWLVDRHGRSPKLARRDGKILVFGYGAQWAWVGYLWEVAGRTLGPGKPGADYQREVDRLRTCEEGWKLMGEAYRRLEADVGQPLYCEMDLAPSLFSVGISDWGAAGNARAATLAATRIAARDFPLMGQFLSDGDVPAMARAVVAAGHEWSHPIFFQYENYGNFQRASHGLDEFRAGWEEAREIPATLLQQITWNDYHETTNLSPGYNSRYAYYDLTGQFIRWWKTGREPTSDHDRLYIFSHKYVHGARIFPFQGREFADNVIEIATLLPRPARLRLPGRPAADGSREWDVPAGLSFHQVPLTAGPVVVELLRDGLVAQRLEADDPVSDRPFRADLGKTCTSSEDERLWHEDFGAATPYFRYSEYGDADHDGLPNWFEMLYFGTWGDMATAGAADPAADPDGDGVSNLEEYRRQTDPLDPASH